MPDDDMEARVTGPEQEVARLREQITLTLTLTLTLTGSDATAARVLAAGADRDVSEVRTELRAYAQALNALREIQLEQGREVREGFASQARRIDELAREMDELTREMQGGFTTMATDMAQITAPLTEIRGSERDG